MAYSEARKRATKKYFAEHLYICSLRFPKHYKEIMAQAADGQSINSYVKSLIEEDLRKKGIEF